MKLLLVCDNYPPEMNANARIFSEIAALWAKGGETVCVITSHPNFPTGCVLPGHTNVWRKETIEQEVRVTRVKTYMHANQGVWKRTLDFLSFGISSFFFGLFIRGEEVIIGVTPQLFAALSACLLSICKRKPFLLILCDLWPDAIVANKAIKKGIAYNIIKKLECFLYKKAHSIVVLSPYFHSYLQAQGILTKPIIEMISGANTAFYPRAKSSTLLQKYELQKRFVVGYIGTFGASHNHEDILEVFASLQETPLHCLMIGEGVKKKALLLQKEILALANVTIDGPFPADTIPDYWSLCDVAIVPLADTDTNKTVIPSKIIEAMAMGLPVILYMPQGEATRFFAASEATWHVPSGDIEGLTNLLLQIASVREEKQKQAYAFSQQYSRENNAHLLLQEILAMKREKT